MDHMEKKLVKQNMIKLKLFIKEQLLATNKMCLSHQEDANDMLFAMLFFTFLYKGLVCPCFITGSMSVSDTPKLKQIDRYTESRGDV